MKRILFIHDEIVNSYNIRYVKDEEPRIEGHKKIKRRFCTFKCHCGKFFTSRLNDVIREKRTSCGCRKGNKPYVYTSGTIINGVKFVKTLGTFKYYQMAIFICPLCGRDWKSSIGNIKAGNTKSCCGKKIGWSKSRWEKMSDTAILYKVRLYNDSESFIKIGMTTKDIEKRMKGIPYSFDVIKIIHGNSGYIHDLEHRIKRIRRGSEYKPNIVFKGDTECYIK
jgi:hypothetical protein